MMGERRKRFSIYLIGDERLLQPGWMLPEIVDLLAVDLQPTESEPRSQLFRNHASTLR